MRVIITPRRRRFLGDIPGTVIGKGAEGILGASGIVFPGLGFLIGLALAKLGVFADDDPGQLHKNEMAQLKLLADAVKAKEYARADSLASYQLFRYVITASYSPGIENLFFIAIFGNAVQSGDYSHALAFARQVDDGQNIFDVWLANENALIQRERDRIIPALDPGNPIARGDPTVETRELFDGDSGQYILQQKTDDGGYITVRPRGDGSD